MGGVRDEACGGCPIDEVCAVGDRNGASRMEGRSFAGAAALCFLVPLALAVLGAVVSGGEPIAQLAAGTAGLAAGAVATQWLMTRCGRA